MLEPNHKLEFKDGYTGKVVSIEFARDSNLSEWKDILKTIMVSASFNDSLLNFLDVTDYDDGGD